MDKRYQVFISSTFADLKEERRKVIQTLMELDCIPSGMELFPAADEDQFEFIKKVIDDCDYYLLIIGGRYGSLTAQGISYTEQEYEYALSKQLKVIALLHEDPSKISLDKSEQNPELREQLIKFREKVSNGRLVRFWKNIDELPGIVALSLTKTIKMHPAIGWVRADKVSSEELLEEINKLRKENTVLSAQLSEVNSSVFLPKEEKEFSLIFDKLNRFVDFTIIVHPKTLIGGLGGFEESGESVTYSFNIGSTIPFISKLNCFDSFVIPDIIVRELSNNYDPSEYRLSSNQFVDISDELKMLGFVKVEYFPSSGSSDFPGGVLASLSHYETLFTEKIQRYKYWLELTGRMPDGIVFEKSTN